MVIENLTLDIFPINIPSGLTDIFMIVGSIATLGLAILISIQTKKLKEQTQKFKEQVEEMKEINKMVYRPKLAPRFVRDDKDNKILVIANLGQASAIDVDIKLCDGNNGKKIDVFKPFAVAGRETLLTSVSFTKYPRIIIKGTYADLAGGTTSIDELADIEKLHPIPKQPIK